MTTNRVDNSDNSVLYTLQLPSKLESITTLENFIDTLHEQNSIPENVYANMLTCLNEVVINSIIHGNKQDETKKVYINLEIIGKRDFQFTIADEGEGFDYNNLPDPTAPDNLENLSGRGIFIVKHLADQCIFNMTGNQIELHFKI
ncbi:serine/threonine-protein kinase RsbW [Arcticibacter pallidicorallinus]|uniref:Serine/threonine-protein kinase RsbW n=1 Tax=Arcticibacter pallidicorallinus TaxID=1259464 RepID=A0A2T0U7M0_9SPHI|nr:ATP-binding protein [Arcticibacter pallidicorallinus]PRY53858.1 serine/threonine-protein kinase RsbW [Arcticibacter pallidicorallinus]